MFQFHAFRRQTFIDILIYLIDISDFTTVRGASRTREIEISIFTDDVILGGGGVGSLMTFDDEGEGGGQKWFEN